MKPGGLVLLVSNIPTPYRIPLYEEIGRQLAERETRFHVIFAASGTGYRRWRVPDRQAFRFSHEILPGGSVQDASALGGTFTYLGLGKRVRELDPSVIVTVGFSLAAARLMLIPGMPRPVLIWTGATRDIGSDMTLSIRRGLRWLLAQRAAGFVSYGSASREYLLGLGIPPDRVHIALNTVDTEYFARRVAESAAESPNGGDTLHRLLYLGYLNRRKNVARVLEVVRELSRDRADFVLDIVGDGPDRSRLEALVREMGLDRRVTFHGYRQQHELPPFFAQATCFLFQTDHDIWGLVLNEAMAAGVPCIASPKAGATQDLIEHGRTGFVADFGYPAEVAAVVKLLFDRSELRNDVASAAQQNIRDHASLRVSAAGFVAAVTAAVTSPLDGDRPDSEHVIH